MRRTAAIRTITPIGRLTKKIHRQSKLVTRRPPKVGPAIVATPATAPQMPSAVPRRSAGNVATMRAMVCGISMAAPSPCRARAPISSAGFWEIPHSRLATVKTATPKMKTVRCPRRSPSRPAVMSSTARTSR